MFSSAKTQLTGSLVDPGEVGGRGRFPFGQCGGWYEYLRTWLCQTRTQVRCPVLDRPAPPWPKFQIRGFQGCSPVGTQDRKLGRNKKILYSSMDTDQHTHSSSERFDLSVLFERQIFHLEGLLDDSFHALCDPGPLIDSLPRIQFFTWTEQPPLLWAWSRKSPL